MASTKEYLDFVMEQLSGLDEVSSRAMMGAYILYYRGRIFGGIYDGMLTPKNVNGGSHLKVWCLCEKGHEWQADVNNRVMKNIGCPICSRKKVLAGFNDLGTLMPELVAEWHPIKNGALKASDVRPGSNKKAWWLCPVCGHEWQAVINSRSQGHGCPNCNNRKK